MTFKSRDLVGQSFLHSKVQSLRGAGFARYGQANVVFNRYSFVDIRNKALELSFNWILPDGTISNENGPLELPVHKYFLDASSWNTTDHIWSENQEEMIYRTGPYACNDHRLVVTTMLSTLQDSRETVMDWIRHEHRNDSITRITYEEAQRYKRLNDSDLIDIALELQCGAVMSQGQGSISDGSAPPLLEDTLPNNSNTRQLYGRRVSTQENPIPMALHHQIEVAILLILHIRRDEFLRTLDLLLQTTSMPWYEMFLAFYIILYTLEWMTAEAIRYRTMCEKTVRPHENCHQQYTDFFQEH